MKVIKVEFYPQLDMSQWIEESKQSFKRDEKNDYDFDIIKLNNRNGKFKK